MFKTLTLVAAFAGCATILSAQAIDPDTFKVNYFNNGNSTPDETIQLTNVGTTAGGNICADIYVFDPNQELSETCSCFLSPDGLRTLSVNTDLLSNPLTGVPLTSGTIKIVSATDPTTCAKYPTSPKPTAGLRAWGTHVYDSAITETDFLDAGLSAAELSALGAQASAAKLVGSGRGVCSCGVGD
jgi:hypothetical protein